MNDPDGTFVVYKSQTTAYGIGVKGEDKTTKTRKIRKIRIQEGSTGFSIDGKCESFSDMDALLDNYWKEYGLLYPKAYSQRNFEKGNFKFYFIHV